MATKEQILRKHGTDAMSWSALASLYFQMDKNIQDAWNKTTVDLYKNANDLTPNERAFIGSVNLDLKRMGYKPLKLEKKKLKKVM
jgi:hypothetical protein